MHTLGNFSFGDFSPGVSKEIIVESTFKLNEEKFNYFLENTTSTNKTIINLASIGTYVDQTPVNFKIYYERDLGAYSSVPKTGVITKYSPKFYGNVGCNILGEIERCKADGTSSEQGEYIHWKSLYFESLNTTSKNQTQPSQYLSPKSSDITIKYSTQNTEAGTVHVYDLPVTNALINLISQNPTSSNPYSEINKPPQIISKNLVDTLGSKVTIQIIFKSNFNGSFMGTFTIDPGKAKLHISGNASGGVAVGMFSSSSNDNVPRFEVAENHTSVFHGPVIFENTVSGIDNSITYRNGVEVNTGNHSINNKPIYRYIWSGTVTGDGSRVVATIPYMNILLSIRGSLLANGQYYNVPHIGRANDKYNCSFYIIPSSNSSELHLTMGENLTGTVQALAIIEYTK